MISLIVATDRQGLIGIGGKLPWHRPADLKNFRKITMNKDVIVGRKTYMSIGNLPGRNMKVMSRRPDLNIPTYTVRDMLYDYNASYAEAIVIGGSETYKAFAPFVERIYLTIINQITPLNDSEAVFFPWPAFSGTHWQCVKQKMLGPDFYYVYDKVKAVNYVKSKSKTCFHSTSGDHL